MSSMNTIIRGMNDGFVLVVALAKAFFLVLRDGSVSALRMHKRCDAQSRSRSAPFEQNGGNSPSPDIDSSHVIRNAIRMTKSAHRLNQETRRDLSQSRFSGFSKNYLQPEDRPACE